MTAIPSVVLISSIQDLSPDVRSFLQGVFLIFISIFLILFIKKFTGGDDE